MGQHNEEFKIKNDHKNLTRMHLNMYIRMPLNMHPQKRYTYLIFLLYSLSLTKNYLLHKIISLITKKMPFFLNKYIYYIKKHIFMQIANILS